MEFEKDNQPMDWKKEPSAGEPFDFDAFLGADSLDDRVTEATGGRDLLEPDAFGGGDNYVPRRRYDSERGRHEAPAPEGEEEPEEDGPAFREEPKPAFDPADPRYAAPERPRVVVSEPRSVYVTPPGAEERVYDEPEPRPGMGAGAKWAVAILITLAIVGAALLLILGLFGGRGARPADPAATVDPSQTLEPSAAPTDTPAPTEPAKRTYTVTVTAGSGGSVNPSGAVTVEEGGSVTFAIVPNGGYELSQLLVDGASVSLIDNYTFTDVRENHTIYAVFAQSATPSPAPTDTPEPTPAPTDTPAPTAPPETPAPTDPPTVPDESVPGAPEGEQP